MPGRQTSPIDIDFEDDPVPLPDISRARLGSTPELKPIIKRSESLPASSAPPPERSTAKAQLSVGRIFDSREDAYDACLAMGRAKEPDFQGAFWARIKAASVAMEFHCLLKARVSRREGGACGWQISLKGEFEDGTESNFRVAFISTEHSCEDSPRTFTAAEAAILQTKYDSLDALKAAVDQLAPGYALSILGNFRGAASEIVSYGCRAACCPFVLRGQRLSADKWVATDVCLSHHEACKGNSPSAPKRSTARKSTGGRRTKSSPADQDDSSESGSESESESEQDSEEGSDVEIAGINSGEATSEEEDELQSDDGEAEREGEDGLLTFADTDAFLRHVRKEYGADGQIGFRFAGRHDTKLDQRPLLNCPVKCLGTDPKGSASHSRCVFRARATLLQRSQRWYLNTKTSVLEHSDDCPEWLRSKTDAQAPPSEGAQACKRKASETASPMAEAGIAPTPPRKAAKTQAGDKSSQKVFIAPIVHIASPSSSKQKISPEEIDLSASLKLGLPGLDQAFLLPLAQHLAGLQVTASMLSSSVSCEEVSELARHNAPIQMSRAFYDVKRLALKGQWFTETVVLVQGKVQRLLLQDDIQQILGFLHPSFRSPEVLEWFRRHRVDMAIFKQPPSHFGRRIQAAVELLGGGEMTVCQLVMLRCRLDAWAEAVARVASQEKAR